MLYNTSGRWLEIENIDVVDGDLNPLYHGFFDCMGHVVGDEGCTLYMGEDSTHGTLAVTASDLSSPGDFTEDVAVSQ